MPLPLIPVLLGGASLIASAVGIKKGFDAKEDFERAERIAENAKRSHERAISNLATDKKLTNEKIQDLIKLKVDIFQDQIKHLVDTVKRCYKNSKSTMENFEETISIDDIKRMEEMVVSTGSAVASSALEGLFAGSKAVAALVALSGGAAATNATLAWLGGGALAAGGLGMAGGTAVLGGLVVGPALAVGGFMLANKAEEALEKARDYETKADNAIAGLNRIIAYLDKDVSGAVNLTIDTTKKLLDKFRQCPNEQILDGLYKMIVFRLFDGKRSDGTPCLVDNISAKLDAILNRY